MLGFNADGTINHNELEDMRAEEQREIEEAIEQAVVNYLREKSPESEKEMAYWSKKEPQLTEQINKEKAIKETVTNYLKQKTQSAEEELSYWFKSQPDLTSEIMGNYCDIGFSELDEF